MEPVYSTLAAMAVTCIFCAYRAYEKKMLYRERKLRERVTFMLWVMANGFDLEPSELTSAKT